jgi:L-ectoine synthase
MKIQRFSQKADIVVPGVMSADGSCPIQGRAIVDVTDDVGFSTYEIQSPGGSTYQLTSSNHHQDQTLMNHIYYCINGEADIILAEMNDTFRITRNAALALPPATSGTMKTHNATRILVVHVKSSSDDPSKPDPLFRRTEDLVGTDRDVDWQHGRSRRLLVEVDGFNISLHNTICYPNSVSQLCYRQNHELAYYVRGDVTYTWNDGNDASSFKQEDQSDGEGWQALMNEHDAHTIHTKQIDCEAICIFYPALKGTETHDFTKQGLSVY